MTIINPDYLVISIQPCPVNAALKELDACRYNRKYRYIYLPFLEQKLSNATKRKMKDDP